MYYVYCFRFAPESCLFLRFFFFFFQAEDGIRDLVRSRGLGDVYKRQIRGFGSFITKKRAAKIGRNIKKNIAVHIPEHYIPCLLYTSDAADERSSVDLGGRRIIKKKKKNKEGDTLLSKYQTHIAKHEYTPKTKYRTKTDDIRAV